MTFQADLHAGLAPVLAALAGDTVGRIATRAPSDWTWNYDAVRVTHTCVCEDGCGVCEDGFVRDVEYPWTFEDVAEAFERLITAGLYPWPLDTHHVPAWWSWAYACEPCREADSPCDECLQIDANYLAAPHWNLLGSMVAVTSLGPVKLRQCEALVASLPLAFRGRARVEWRAPWAWRVLSAAELRTHHREREALRGERPVANLPEACSFAEMANGWVEVPSWCAGRDDDLARAYPVARALALDVGVHVLATEPRLVLGVEAL